MFIAALKGNSVTRKFNAYAIDIIVGRITLDFEGFTSQGIIICVLCKFDLEGKDQDQGQTHCFHL